jgi:hypothetical protein
MRSTTIPGKKPTDQAATGQEEKKPGRPGNRRLKEYGGTREKSPPVNRITGIDNERTPEADNSLLAAALKAAARGIPVFPVHHLVYDGRCCSCGGFVCPCPKGECSCPDTGMCHNAGKHPITENGLKDATTKESQIRKWWSEHPDAHIGAATGGKWIVVDYDGEAGLSDRKELEFDQLGCPSVITGSGGRHDWIQMDGGDPIRNAQRLGGRSIDIRGEGGYVILPPSSHVSGNQYLWETSLNDGDGNHPQVLDWIRAQQKRQSTGQGEGEGTWQAERPDNADRSRVHRAKKYLKKVPPAISGEGGHDHTFGTVIAVIRQIELSRDEAMLSLQEWNQTCSPPWNNAELLHKVDDAIKTIERDGVQDVPVTANETDPNSDPNDYPDFAEECEWEEAMDKPKSPSERFDDYSAAELDDAEFELTYLVENMIVEGQPGIWAGPQKTLKTNTAIDLVISLASGKPFLGQFSVTKKVNCALLSGESGKSTIQETARRVAKSKGIKLRNLGESLRFCFDLPTLTCDTDLLYLKKYCVENKIDFLFLDPLYLMLGDVGEHASNLFRVGEQLRKLSKLCETLKVTPWLCHHTKNRHFNRMYEPVELEDIAWAGFREFARQWFLIGRREAYDPEVAGHHQLWINGGGSAGHSFRHALDISEGRRKNLGGRSWYLKLMTPDQARAKKAETKEEAKEARKSETKEKNLVKVLEVLQTFGEQGETKSQIKIAAGITNTGELLIELEKRGLVEKCDVFKNCQKKPFDGWRTVEKCGVESLSDRPVG